MKQYATAYQKYIHEAPRKLRLIVDAIRGKQVDASLEMLQFTPNRAARSVRKLLVQAKANAISGAGLTEKGLKVSGVVVEEGPRIKRWQPVSRGMAHSIVRRTSHVKITVEGNLPTAEKHKG